MSRTRGRVRLTLAIGVLATMPAFSAGEAPQISHTRAESSTLTESERRRAAEWSLSPGEWTRYRRVMEGVRGAVSAPGISPIEVLGIHARDASERRRYAERWARLMHEDAERVLAFERAYREAFRRLFPKAHAVDVGALAASEPDAAPAAEALALGDRLLVFVDVRCAAACARLIAGLLRRSRMSPGVGVDLYFVGQPGTDEIQAWARGQGITAERVRAGGVTLNHDLGSLARLLGGSDQTFALPIVMRRRGDQISRISDPERLAL